MPKLFACAPHSTCPSAQLALAGAQQRATACQGRTLTLRQQLSNFGAFSTFACRQLKRNNRGDGRLISSAFGGIMGGLKKALVSPRPYNVDIEYPPFK